MKKLAIIFLAIATIGTGCKKFTENINTNTNQPTVVTPDVVLAAGLSGTAARLGTAFFNTNRWMGYMARSGNFIQTIPTETYAIDPGYADGDFQNIYGVLTRFNYIEHNSAGDPFYIGVAKVMKAFYFSTLVDGFNNIPYSQAFNLAQFPTPKYDDAQGIYNDLILQIDSSVTYFQNAQTKYYPTAAATSLTTDDLHDIMFGRGTGGADKASAVARLNLWIRFANTVKLRLLMTERAAVTASYIHTELAKCTANGQGYIGANQSATVNPGYSNNSAAQQNPFYGSFVLTSGSANNNASFYRANQYFINYGNDNNDYRYTDIYGTVGGTWAGNYDGDPAAASNTNTSGIRTGGGLLVGSTQDEFIIPDFESLFLQAEAVQEGYTEVSTKTAAQLVRTANEQSFIFVDDTGTGDPAADATDADGYMDGQAGDPDVDVAAGGLQAIMTQKWSALAGVNWEQAYTDYRRTGYPIPDGTNFGFSHNPAVIQHSSPDVTGKAQSVNLPYRYLYPQSEVSTNSKNIPAGTTAYTTIFWDKREK